MHEIIENTQDIQYILKDHQDDLFCETPDLLDLKYAIDYLRIGSHKEQANFLMSKQDFVQVLQKQKLLLMKKINSCFYQEEPSLRASDTAAA